MDGTFTTGNVTMSLVGWDLVASNIGKWTNDRIEGRKRVAERIKTMAVPFMKQNAPWRDQTGRARQGLDADVEHQPTFSIITIHHGADVEYGPALETMRGGRYAILAPTIGWLVGQLPNLLQEESSHP